jgi:hypothetical protein
VLENWVQLIWPGSEHLTSILETENMRAKKSVFPPQDALVGLHPMARIGSTSHHLVRGRIGHMVFLMAGVPPHLNMGKEYKTFSFSLCLHQYH